MAGSKWRARRKRFKPFLPPIIIGNVRLLVNEAWTADKDTAGLQEMQYYVFNGDMAAGTYYGLSNQLSDYVYVIKTINKDFR